MSSSGFLIVSLEILFPSPTIFDHRRCILVNYPPEFCNASNRGLPNLFVLFFTAEEEQRALSSTFEVSIELWRIWHHHVKLSLFYNMFQFFTFVRFSKIYSCCELFRSQCMNFPSLWNFLLCFQALFHEIFIRGFQLPATIIFHWRLS